MKQPFDAPGVTAAQAAAEPSNAGLTRRQLGGWLTLVLPAWLATGPTSALAQDDEGFRIGGKPGRGWRLLGQVQARRSVDRDEVRVRADRAYSAIRLRVLDAPVEILQLRIYFRNGGSRQIDVRQFIERGGSTRRIDLPGERRFIDRLVFWHKTPAGARRRATVQVWGRG